VSPGSDHLQKWSLKAGKLGEEIWTTSSGGQITNVLVDS